MILTKNDNLGLLNFMIVNTYFHNYAVCTAHRCFVKNIYINRSYFLLANSTDYICYFGKRNQQHLNFAVLKVISYNYMSLFIISEMITI